MELICPLMSTADKKVYCTKECALNIEASGFKRACAITQLVDAIDHNSDILDNIHTAMPDD